MPTFDRLHRLPGSFALVRCETCGAVRLSPRPTAEHLATYYPSDYYAYQGDRLPRYQRVIQRALGGIQRQLREADLERRGYRPTRREPVLAARLLSTWMDRSLLLQRVAGYPWEIPPAASGGLAVDVGSGAGHFLASLVPLGWRVQGVDPSHHAADSAARTFGISVHVGQLESAPIEPGSVDFIHMRHVLEHLEHPLATLRHAFGLLRPGGWLYIETPNIDSYGAAACGPYWFGIDSPRHLWLFGPAALERSLNELGFELDRMWSFVVIRLCSWESTYRREQRLGRRLRWRPSIGLQDVPHATVTSVRARVGVHLNQLSGDVVACWAHKPIATGKAPS